MLRFSIRDLVWLIALFCAACEPASAPVAKPTSVTAPPPPPPPPPSPWSAGRDVPQIQDDVRRMVTAAFTGDFETTLNHTHAKLVSALGGRDAAIRQMKELGVSAKLGQMKVEEVAFPAAPTFLTGKENEFVIVPMRIRTSLNNRRAELTNFQLGARPAGTSKWGYLDGKKIDRPVLQSFFPDFPPDYELPPR